MKRHYWLVVFILDSLLNPFGAEAQRKLTAKEPDMEAIRNLEHQWMKAEFDLDTVRLKHLLDATFLAIDANGTTAKNEEIQNLYSAIKTGRNNGVRIDSFHLRDFEINLYSSTAVVTFESFLYGTNTGVPFIRRSRFFDVVVKRGNSWKGAASHIMRGLPLKSLAYEQIKKRSLLWNASYNTRDTLAFYSLLDSAIIFTSGGPPQIGKEACKSICRKLFVLRPDITWVNQMSALEVNEQWEVAYETGAWTEAWTEKGDTAPSRIQGKYCFMWQKKGEEWYITSVIFTPLLCTGPYCNKK